MPRKVKDTRKPCPTHLMTLFEANSDADAMIRFEPETGGQFAGTVEQINGLLTAMGYHEVAIRRNMMSRLPYLEAKLTPIYCSPASETYWSM